MLNVFYWYGIIWAIVLSFYELGWSNYCTTLNGFTLSFFVISIIVSFILGTVFRNAFKYTSLEEDAVISRNHTVTILIWIMAIADFAYEKDVPLISILMGRSTYSDFAGLPLVHTVLENMVIFFSAYLFYLFLETKEK